MLFFAVVIGLMMATGISLSEGEPAMLLFTPLMALGVFIAIPFVLLAITVAFLGSALGLAVPVLLVGGPLYLLYRLLGGHGPNWSRRSTAAYDGNEVEEALRMAAAQKAAARPETLLRRRYVAGELTYQEFQSGMVGILKERFARGEMALTEYEAEIERLLEPARRLDVARDPALAAAAIPGDESSRSSRSLPRRRSA
jgi:hypothetical protein